MPGLRKLIFKKAGTTTEATGIAPENNYNAYRFILKGLEVGVGFAEPTATEIQLHQAFFWNHESEDCTLVELRSLFVLTIHEGASFDSFKLEEVFFHKLSGMLESVSWAQDTAPLDEFNREQAGRYSLEQRPDAQRVEHAYAVGEMRLFQSTASIKSMPNQTQVEIEVSRAYQHA
jgi:hypothetical protein